MNFLRFLVAGILCLGSTMAYAGSDSFQFPINNWNYYKDGGFGFGQYNFNFRGYHLAQDTKVSRTPTGTVVVAPSNGVVKFAGLAFGYGSSACNNKPGKAGYVVVIEHTLTNGTKVCSTLGHLQGGIYNPAWHSGLVPNGTSVSRGQYIGKVADYPGCPSGNWHHLHFGIRKNGYAGGANLAGYTRTTAGLSAWHEPNNFVTQHSGGSGSTYYDVKKAGDFDGDGRKEFVRYYPANGEWRVALSTGSSFAPLQTWIYGHGVGSNGQYVGDINGDGRADVLVFFENTGSLYVAKSRGYKFAGYYRAGVNIGRGMNNKFMADVNGDGREDFVGYVNGKWYVSLSDGRNFGTWKRVLTGHGVGSNRRLMADVNGDGRADALVFFNNTGSWYVAYGKTNGYFTGYVQWAAGHGHGSTEQLVADINGDNKADAICFWNLFGSTGGVWIVWNSNGSRFVPDNTFRLIGNGYGSSVRLVADYTGDHKADLGFYFKTLGWYVSVSKGYYFGSGRAW